MILKGENRSPRSKTFPSTTLTTTSLMWNGLEWNQGPRGKGRRLTAYGTALKPAIHASNISNFSNYLTFFTISLSFCYRETIAMYC